MEKASSFFLVFLFSAATFSNTVFAMEKQSGQQKRKGISLIGGIKAAFMMFLLLGSQSNASGGAELGTCQYNPQNCTIDEWILWNLPYPPGHKKHPTKACERYVEIANLLYKKGFSPDEIWEMLPCDETTNHGYFSPKSCVCDYCRMLSIGEVCPVTRPRCAKFYDTVYNGV
ncbi:hypothetical protein KAU11_05895 [Candidatus Babeliales bacterium]|nr:hypothetical protein [Candidatus Babeliales bacterium]